MKENIHINTHMLVNYAYGLLEPELAEYVQKHIDDDLMLQQEYRGIMTFMNDYPDEDVEDLIEQFSNSTQIKKNKLSISFNKKWIAIAASILLLIGAGWLLINQKKSNHEFACLTTDELLNKEHKFTPHERDIPTDSLKWLNSFNQDNFNETINMLTTSEKNLQPVEQYYLALSYLFVLPPNYDSSSKYFKSYLESGSFTLESKCHLYLGAIFLKKNLLNEAKIEFNKVSQEDKPQADFLLRNMK